MSDINPLNLSDDEVDLAIRDELALLNTEEASDGSTEGNDETESEVTEVDVEDSLTDDKLEDEEEAETETEEEAKTDDKDTDSSEGIDKDLIKDNNKVTDGLKDDSDKEDKENKGNEADAQVEINYKEEYDKLLSPFNANGKALKVDTIEDARTLMQMGANYHKKMAALKPNLKLVKMLSNNDLLDEEKIGFLIDLSKKNPDAVKKLVKDSGLDPLDIDTDNIAYQPKTYTVSDNEVDLAGILEEIRETDTFDATVKVIGTKWDEASKQAISHDPTIIRVLNDQMASGVYKQISDVVDRERILGRLNGVSDIQAYKQVGDAINAAGGFGGSVQTDESEQASKSDSAKVNKTNSKVDKERDDKRRRAAPTQRKSTAVKSKINPLNMTDEEFEKNSAALFAKIND